MPALQVDIYNPGSYVEQVPHDVFDRLRAEAPVYWHEEPEGPGFWALTKYADVVSVSRDWQTFTSAQGTAITYPEGPSSGALMMMLNMDPPRHTKLRKLVQKAMSPRMALELEPMIRSAVGTLLDTMVEKGECDYVEDFAAVLPIQVISAMVGVPVDDVPLMLKWSNALAGTDDPEYGVSRETVIQCSIELFQYAAAMAADRQANPRDDLMSLLVHAEVDGDRLSPEELSAFFLLLIVAGNETTRNLVSGGTLALIEHPDQWHALVADRGLVPNAVDEMLRYVSPVMQFRRTATRDVVVGDTTVREGDKVVLWYIAANHDAAVYPDPHRLDVTRPAKDHVAFGAGGPHFCLGAHLAKLEATVALEGVVDRLGAIEPTGAPARLRSNFINGIKHLPVRVTAR